MGKDTTVNRKRYWGRSFILSQRRTNKEEINKKGIRILNKVNSTLVMIRMMRNVSWIHYKKKFGKLINERLVFYSDFEDCYDIIENDFKDTPRTKPWPPAGGKPTRKNWHGQAGHFYCWIWLMQLKEAIFYLTTDDIHASDRWYYETKWYFAQRDIILQSMTTE